MKMKKAAMVLAFLLVFVAGYLAGSIQTRRSMALELGGVSGTVESLKSLGKTIVEMQKNVDALQQNIEEVKKVRDDISSYQGVYDKVTGSGTPEGKEQLKKDATKGLINILTEPDEKPAK